MNILWKYKKQKGFTLIELLVVISIISLLSSIIMSAINLTKARARDAVRRAQVRQIGTALELYYTVNGSYPPTYSIGAPAKWFGACSNAGAQNDCDNSTYGVGWCTTSGAKGYVPNLAPTYIPVLPKDPKDSWNGCYLYASTGTDYMFYSDRNVENYNNTDPMRRPQYPNENDYAIYTPGASLW